jgi:dUTP pyrophosphatase
MIKFIRMSESAIVPTRGSDGAAAYDLFANEEIEIPAGCRALVATGVSTEFDDSVGAKIFPRSGLSVRGIDIGAGVIDSDYRGEIKALLINNGSGSLFVNYGDRIAQIVFFPIITDAIEWCGTVSETERGAGGFGSTGT